MPSHGSTSQGSIRPGDVGFPVGTFSGAGVGDSASTFRLTRQTKTLAGALIALLALHFGGLSLSGTAPTIMACGAIMLFGLPHGTLDLEIIKRERGIGRLGMSGLLLLYLGLAAAMAALWRVAPVTSLGIFLLVAVHHFAEDWSDLKSAFLAQGMAIALLAAPALIHFTELSALFAALSGRTDSDLVANLLLLLAPTSGAVASVAVWTMWRTGFRDQAIVGALVLVAMVFLPPVIGFALFFCLYHSPRHLGTALARVAWAPSSLRIVALLTLAAFGIAVALFVDVVRADLPDQFVAASFMTLSLLTVPHMVVPYIVDAMARARSGARLRHNRPTA